MPPREGAKKCKPLLIARGNYWMRCASGSDVLIVPKRRTRRMAERISSRYPRHARTGYPCENIGAQLAPLMD